MNKSMYSSSLFLYIFGAALILILGNIETPQWQRAAYLMSLSSKKGIDNLNERLLYQDSFLKLAPGHAKTLFDLGKSYYQYGQYDEALYYLKKAVVRDLGYIPSHEDVAALYEKTTKQQMARDLIRFLDTLNLE